MVSQVDASEHVDDKWALAFEKARSVKAFSMHRHLDRLAEESVEVVRVPVDPVDTLSERVAAAITPRTAAVMLSAVMFKDAAIVPDLSAVTVKLASHFL